MGKIISMYFNVFKIHFVAMGYISIYQADEY